MRHPFAEDDLMTVLVHLQGEVLMLDDGMPPVPHGKCLVFYTHEYDENPLSFRGFGNFDHGVLTGEGFFIKSNSDYSRNSICGPTFKDGRLTCSS